MIAETFAKRGRQLRLFARLLNEQVCQATGGRTGQKVWSEDPRGQVNVTLFDECEKWVQAVMGAFGRVDILVNNAGITKDNLLMRMSDAEWDAVIAVNLKGPFNCTKAVVRPMFKAQRGRIINIASIVGLMGNAGQANYSSSKGGLVALTKTCAREFASRQVLVNAIAPGFIRTAMTDKLTDDQKKKLTDLIPLTRLGESQDVANAALFLAVRRKFLHHRPHHLRQRRDVHVDGFVVPAKAGTQDFDLVFLPCVYILASGRNGTLYIGVTSDLVKRVWQHKSDFVRDLPNGIQVHSLVWFEVHGSMELAIKKGEKTIKEWKRRWKLELIERANPDWKDLYSILV